MRLGATSIGLQATILGPLTVGRTDPLFYLLFMKLLYLEAIFSTFCSLDGYGIP
jgi:hypothetical protein